MILVDLQSEKLGAPQTLSTRTLVDVRSVLRRAVTRAQARDKVTRNVVLLCETPTGQTGRPSKALTLEQAHALVEHARRSPPSAPTCWCRCSPVPVPKNCARLTWSHVDLTGSPDAEPPIPPHIARLALGTSWRRHQDPDVPPHPRAAAPLRRSPDRAAPAPRRRSAVAGSRWGDSDLVFASEAGTPLDAANVRRGFRRIATAAGLNAAQWTPRELRHSFVSLLSDKGVPIEQIARLVGHTGGSAVTETVYRKQLRPVIDDGAIAMNELFPRAIQ